nr:TMEM175 family protein [uncultured Carboxylicivirga sp.]
MKYKILKEQDKEEFQVSRVAGFSDGVFAFAITLLVIDIKIPEVNMHHISDAVLWTQLKELTPKLIGFFVSFFVIAMYWLSHHRIFKFVVSVNKKLLWGNLLFLLPIVLMPFSTGFFSRYFTTSVKLPFAIYTLTICMAGFFCFRLWKLIGNPKNKLSAGLERVIVNYNLARALIVPVFFMATLLLSFITGLAYFVPILTFFIPQLITRYYNKKYPLIMKKYYH